MTRQPIRIATDGSFNGQDRGYGIAAEDGLLDYGPVAAEDNVELAAIERALILHPDRPVVIHTDADEAILRFVDRIPPKPKAAHRVQIERILATLDARTEPVTFVRVNQRQRQEPLHAVSHLLAFLGRTGRDLDEETLAVAVDRIHASATPDDLAHAMVVNLIFPASGETLFQRNHRAEAQQFIDADAGANAGAVKARTGHPLSDDVEHFEATCPVHGLTLFARHRAGFRGGAQRYKERCLACHSTYNLAHPSVTRSRLQEDGGEAQEDAVPEVESPVLEPVASGVEREFSSAVGRKHIVHPHNLRSVLGRDLEAGMVLATGIVLDVERDPEDDTYRLEMAGADIHYVASDEPVTVLAQTDRDALDLFSVGVYVARKGA